MAEHGERPIRVLVVNFSPLVQVGIRQALDDPEFELLSEISTSEGIKQQVKELRPTVVLTELLAKDTSAINIVSELSDLEDSPAVLVLTRYENDTNVIEAVRAGAKGFLLEGKTNVPLLREAIRAVADGAFLVESENLGQTLQVLGGEDNQAEEGEVLTPQEVAVLRLMASGFTNAEIAYELNISLDSSKRHVSDVIRKMGARSRVHAALLGAQAGIVGIVSREGFDEHLAVPEPGGQESTNGDL